MNQHLNPNVRHDALFLFEAVDSNPNGDPDNGGAPRVDVDTGQGLVTDGAIKRKIRDIVERRAADGDLDADRFRIFITAGTALNDTLAAAYAENGDKPSAKKNAGAEGRARQFMLDRYYDVRMFGAVMSTGTGESKASAGKVTGPVTIGFARTLDRVDIIDSAITRVASTKSENKDNASQMGMKSVVAYGLYQARVSFVPTRDAKVTAEDLEIFWNALSMAFEATPSAARPDVNTRGLYVFSHSSSLGNAPARSLLDRVHVARKADVESPRSFDDYEVAVGTTNLPSGVTYAALA